MASAVLQGDSETTPNEFGTSGGKKSYTLFQGHSGPVFSATFSPLGDFILSSSADSTSMFYLFFSTLSLCPTLRPVHSIIFINCFMKELNCLLAVRLWSTKLNANLVCYKGHNYPVWDVQVCLLSHLN